MGLFDEVAGGIINKVLSGQGGQAGLAEAVMGLLKGSGAGGLEGLAQKFDENGLGELMSSWVGSGENLPVSSDQILQVLGSGQVQQIAQKLGISDSEASTGLADILPQIVDKATPDGSMASGELLNQGLSLVMEKLLGK